MIGESQLLGALLRTMKRIRSDGASLCAHAKSRRVFRFADRAIHQDLVQETVSVTIKVIRNHQVGVASTGVLEPANLVRCAHAAADIARHSPAQQHLPALPQAHRIRTREDYLPATPRTDAATCVRQLRRLFHLCQGAGANLAGSLMTGEDEFAVTNSSGVSCYAASTVAGAKLVTMYRTLSGYASGVARDLAALDLDQLLRQSLTQSLHRTTAMTLPLGIYEVILEPEAVADLATWLGYTAFGAKSVEERTSFLAGHIDDRVMGQAITIYDDGTDPDVLRMPFDFEGVPKQRVVLIERGIAKEPVYDSEYGARFGRPSTGHAMPPDEVEGPLPLHLAIAPGMAKSAEILRACERGIYIPRFHYVNGLLNPREALMTGLTREGAFLIERGKLAAPITTMRFTQSLLEALSHVRSISKERRLIADPSQELGCALMPMLHLGTFHFTGRSES